MKVFCRFAPALPSAAETAEQGRAGGPSPAEPALLLLRIEPAASTSGAARVHLADPATLSRASFTCDGVFLPTPTSRGLAPTSAASQQQQQQQQQLYETTCRRVLPPAPAPARTQHADIAAPPLRTYLAYGQTASGKTFSLFGEATTDEGVPFPSTASSAGGETLLAPGAGVVPRFLHDVFSAAHAEVLVDLACVEVYNEVTTDLVALAASMAVSAVAASTRVRSGDSHSTASRRRGGSATTSTLPRQHLRPVWAAHQLYRAEQEPPPQHRHPDDDAAAPHARDERWATRRDTPAWEQTGCTGSAADTAPSVDACVAPRFVKTAYRSTEKQQVLRCLERARCTTCADALAVLQALLALRQECATSRNHSSSRGHLVLCVRVCRGPDRADTHHSTVASPHAAPYRGEADLAADAAAWVVQHETAFVDLAGSESGRLTEVDVNRACASTVTAAAHTRDASRSRLLTPHAAASVRGSSAHSRASLDTSVLSGASSQRSGTNSDSGGPGSAPTTALVTTTGSAYHRALLLPQPQEEDIKAARARRLRETRCINASLLALRKVFRALYEATQHLGGSVATAGGGLTRRPPLHHAPFKDSALTAILEPFLVPPPPPAETVGLANARPGHTRAAGHPPPTAEAHVVLLVCCSSRSSDFSETVASLRLGAEAAAVNPEVVLRALPVQQREQERHARATAAQQQQQPAIPPRHRTGQAPNAFHRSASAPLRSRVVAAHDGASEVGCTPPALVCATASGGSGACTCGGAPQRAVPLPQAPRHDGAHESEAVTATLREEARRYKATAQQLYTQCKSLCESYDECVAELGRCRAALAERDARVAELEAALQRVTPPAVGVPEPAQPRTTTLLTTASTSTAAADVRGASPTARAPVQQLPASTKFSAAAAAALTMTAGPHTASRSAAREGSGRWVVSVSPFSAASAAGLGTASGGTPAACERSASPDVEDAGSVRDGEAAGAADGSAPRGSRATAGALAESPVLEHPGHDGAAARARQRQHAHARTILHTLLARQIFPARALTEAAAAAAAAKPSTSPSSSSPSPSPSPSRSASRGRRESSPSPVLPTLSACTGATAAAAVARAALMPQSVNGSASSRAERRRGRVEAATEAAAAAEAVRHAGPRSPMTREPRQSPDPHASREVAPSAAAAAEVHCRRSPSSAGATASRSAERVRHTASPTGSPGDGTEPGLHRQTAGPPETAEGASDEEVVTVVVAAPVAMRVDGAESGDLRGECPPPPVPPLQPATAGAAAATVMTEASAGPPPAARVRAPLMPPCRSPSLSLIASSAPATPTSSPSLLVYTL